MVVMLRKRRRERYMHRRALKETINKVFSLRVCASVYFPRGCASVYLPQGVC